MGHADGIDFHAGEEIKDHPEFSWEKTVLRDLDSHPWTTFQTAQ